ncbi:MAG: DUF4336 domain-containing protein [Micropepsaceae bacterium]
MLTPFGANLWLADGADPVSVAGFRYATRMAVIRLADGGLLIWSPIALTPALRDAVTALGEVRFLAAPNTLHHLFLEGWQRAFPRAALHAAPGLDRKRRDLSIAATLSETPPAAWTADIDQAVFVTAITTETVFFHRPSSTVLFTDLIQHFPQGWFTGWRAAVARLDLMVAPAPSVPRKFRLAITRRSAARATLARILAWPSERLVFAHGAPVETGGRQVIADAFAWLGS